MVKLCGRESSMSALQLPEVGKRKSWTPRRPDKNEATKLTHFKPTCLRLVHLAHMGTWIISAAQTNVWYSPALSTKLHAQSAAPRGSLQEEVVSTQAPRQSWHSSRDKEKNDREVELFMQELLHSIQFHNGFLVCLTHSLIRHRRGPSCKPNRSMFN